ncbi:MAG: SigB/SigF/SigG family RNA polymerase sigma factor [Clostridia bacterium]|nr:SigB/SigF/SigG family RNA polymerase sigma factor [Clostridia bacterium]
MLSTAETLRHLRQAQSGDNASKEILITNNSLLVKSIVYRFKNKGVDFDDLYQLGCMGLLKAIYNFDESFNVRFSTYAVPMIIGEIKRFLRDDGEIKVSRIIKYQAYKIARFTEEYQSKHGFEPTVETISQALDISEGDVVLALDSSKMTVSLYETIDDGEDKSQSLIEKIPSQDSEEDMIDSIYLKQLMSKLSEREQKVIMLRYFRDKTQGEVSKILGVSQVQVSRLENKIIKRLKELANK